MVIEGHVVPADDAHRAGEGIPGRCEVNIIGCACRQRHSSADRQRTATVADARARRASNCPSPSCVNAASAAVSTNVTLSPLWISSPHPQGISSVAKINRVGSASRQRRGPANRQRAPAVADASCPSRSSVARHRPIDVASAVVSTKVTLSPL